MKILIVTSNYPRWQGDSTTPFVHNFAVELTNQGHQVMVLAPHFEGAQLLECIDGVQIKRFKYWWPESGQTVCYQGGALGNLNKRPIEKLKLPLLVLMELIATIKAINSFKPDIVNTHWLLPQGFVGALACKLTKTKHVATVHGGDVFSLNSSLMRKLKKFAIDQSALVTVNSSVTEKVTKDLAPNTKTPFLRLPTGILPIPYIPENEVAELRSSLKQSENEKLILFVGRLSEEKGVREAIEATNLILEEGTPVRLVIVGDGHEKAEFETLVDQLRLQDNVTFVGWVANNDVYKYFKACDVFIGPSKQAENGWIEAQGLTFVEAMLCGCPVVGTRSGGIVDSVIPGKTGWLAEPGEHRSLYKQVKQVLESNNTTIIDEAAAFSNTRYLINNTCSLFLKEAQNANQ